MIEMNMISGMTLNKPQIPASQDATVVADKLSEMIATQFFHTLFESLEQDLNKEVYNYFLAEGIALNDEKSGLREHFKTAFLQQLQKGDKGGNNYKHATFAYNEVQAVTGGEKDV